MVRMTAGSCEKSLSIDTMIVVALVEGDRESVTVGGTEARLATAVQHLDVAEVGRRPFGERPGAVGAVVVDHQHVRLGGRRADRREEVDDVVRLVVGGNDDHCAHGSSG